MNYQPGLFKKLIEQIEIIPENDLGIVLTQDIEGNKRLVFFTRAYFHEDGFIIEAIKAIFSYCEKNITFYEFPEYKGKNRSSKRILLDYLNVRYVMLSGRGEFNEIVFNTKYIYGEFDTVPSESNMSDFAKAVLLSCIPFEKLACEVYMDENKLLQLKLVAEVLHQQKAKEYVPEISKVICGIYNSSKE